MDVIKLNNHSIFTISLDYELFWGVRDKLTLDNYYENLAGVEEAVNSMLSIFSKYDIHATWALVGFLFYNDINELKKHRPLKIPSYGNSELCPYQYVESNLNLDSKTHFAPNVISKINEVQNQEIATHTYSHYYCLEDGQTRDEFYEDIKYSIDITKKMTNNSTYSIVFPRNQWNKTYLEVLKELGLLSFRGTEKSWVFDAVSDEENILLKRILRLADSYLNIFGHHTYSLSDIEKNEIYNIPSSRFLRPVSKKLSFLEKRRLKRIKDSMTYAAKNNQVYHLWWHPHNFGVNLDKNMLFLEEILKHFKSLEEKYNMTSLNMKEIALMLDENE